MNPQSSEQTGLKLPSPVTEQVPAGGAPSAENPASTVEAMTGGVEQAAGVAQPAVPPLSAIPLPLPPSDSPVAAPVPPVSLPAAGTQTAADDADLIEKEWVSKAKQIVERTREDPHEQSKELTVFKADYMQKRYNKTIKLSE